MIKGKGNLHDQYRTCQHSKKAHLVPCRRTWRHVTDSLVDNLPSRIALGFASSPIAAPPRRRVGRPLGSRDSGQRAKRNARRPSPAKADCPAAVLTGAEPLAAAALEVAP
jgi:hypothetical protein